VRGTESPRATRSGEPAIQLGVLLDDVRGGGLVGGLAAIEKQNREKAKLLYGLIDEKKGYYKCPVSPESRSVMNIVFRLPTPELEAKLIADAAAAGFVGLKGHRSVGGIRVSAYNAIPLEGIQKLVAYLDDFASKNKA